MTSTGFIQTDVSPNIEIRRLRPRDAPAYIELRAAAVREAPTAFTSSVEDEAGRTTGWAAELFGIAPASAGFVVGAFLDGQLAGIAGCRAERLRQASHKATLFGMAVARIAQGRGLGRALVERLIEEAKSTGQIRQLVLTVSAGNEAAHRLYSRCGFAAFGVEPRAVIVAGEPIDKIHMVRILDGDEG